MYADTGLLFPYIQNYSHDFQQLDEYCNYQKTTNASMRNSIHNFTISEYDLGGEGDLFKAPEPIIEEPVIGVDPMTAAISMISCGEEVIASQGLKVADLEAIQSEQLLREVFYECKKDLMEKAAVEAPLSDVLDIKLPILTNDENATQSNRSVLDVPLSKSVSSGCLNSMEWMHSSATKPSFLDFPGMNFGSVYGMRRAFSEGDIKTLGNSNTSHVNSPREWPLTIGNFIAEDRKEKLSRYRNKKSKRNFGRKIKYACRKALADSQPRIRGRFAKTEETEVSRRQ